MKKFLSLLLILFGANLYSQSICFGSSATITAAPSAVNNSTLTTPSGVFTSTDGVFVVSPTVTTIYTITVPTSTVVTIRTVTVNPRPNVSPTYTQATCTSTLRGFNFNLTFSPSNPPPTYTINWQIPPMSTAAVVPDCITAPTDYSCVGLINPANYQATVIAAGGCQVVVSFTIQNIPAPASFSLQPNSLTQSITCSQPNFVISGNNASLNYTWTNNFIQPVTASSIQVSNALTGTLLTSNLVVVAQNTISGCTNSKTIALVVNTVAPIGSSTPTSQLINCSNAVNLVTLTCSSPSVNFSQIAYSPLLPGVSSFSSNNSPAILDVSGAVGTWTHCVVNNGNGCTSCKNIVVTSNQNLPTFTTTSTGNFSLGCSTKSICNLAFGNPQAGTGGATLTYTFIPPGATVGSVITGPFGTPTSTNVITPGTWTLICHEAGSNCQTKVTVPITLNTFPPVLDSVSYSRGGILTCDTQQVVLKAFSDTQNIGYTWQYGSPASNLQSSSVPVNATLTAANTTSVTYTLTLKDNSNLCTVSSNYTVYHNVAAPTASWAPQIAGKNFITCKDQTITLTNASKTNQNPFFNPTNRVIGFLWEGPTPQIPLSVSSSYTAGIPGVYTITAKDLDNGCTARFTNTVYDNRDFPVVSTNAPLIDCGSKTSTISAAATTTGGSVSYLWKIPTPNHSSGLLNLAACQVNLPGTFTVLVTDNVNGCVTTKTVSVNNASLVASVVLSDTAGFAPLRVNFENKSYSGTNNTTSISTIWSFGNGSSSVTPATSITANALYSLPGTYTVKIWASKTPCKDTVVKIIRVDVPSALEVPNVFTPNGDGINDFYFLKTNSLSKISMSIFDRWGRLIFEVNESTTGNISWDGKNGSGKEVPDGTYFYYLNATGKDGIDYSKKGSITLSR